MSNTATFTVDGTAALKMDASSAAPKTAHIIAFPRIAETTTPANRREGLSTKVRRAFESLHNAVRRVLESSEMYCSLKFEDFRGVAYGVFSKANIKTLTVLSSIVAVLAIAFGA